MRCPSQNLRGGTCGSSSFLLPVFVKQFGRPKAEQNQVLVWTFTATGCTRRANELATSKKEASTIRRNRRFALSAASAALPVGPLPPLPPIEVYFVEHAEEEEVAELCGELEVDIRGAPSGYCFLAVESLNSTPLFASASFCHIVVSNRRQRSNLQIHSIRAHLHDYIHVGI